MPALHTQDLQTLQATANQQPYFAAVQLQLARKLLQENNAAFAHQYQTCLLHFPNQLWLDYLLQQEEAPMQSLPANAEAYTSEKLSQLIAQQAQDFNKEIKGDELLIETAEPLYKTDYFKHQGIDNDSADALAAPALAHKVKKFTDWLKDMKKLHPDAPQFNTSEAEEKTAAAQAQLSLQDKGVLTESMAEVLAQQGKKEKAIAIYQKLSLSNPAKSSYFAAKISSLQEK